MILVASELIRGWGPVTDLMDFPSVQFFFNFMQFLGVKVAKIIDL